MAIECGDERVTYAELHERVNRFGSALRSRCDVRPEERVALLLLDGPEFAYAFFGAIKIGAVPIPTNTLWKAADYRYLLNDSGARVLIVSEELLPEFEKIPRSDLPRAAARRGRRTERDVELERWLADASAELDAQPVSRDAPAFWLYSSGSTGAPKGCVHLQHDMVVCAELFGKGVLGIRPADRCFSVAEAVLRLRPRERAVFSARRRCDEHPLARPAGSRERLRRDRAGIARRCSSRCRPATA